MANTYIGGSDGGGILDPEIWKADMQVAFFDENQALELYATDLRDVLPPGTVIHNPYATLSKVQTYTPGNALTVSDVTATDDSIVVNTTKAIYEYIDRVEAKQAKPNLMKERAYNMQRQLNQHLEQAASANITSANTALDDGDVGGTDGNNIVMNSTTVSKIFAAAGRALDGLRIPTANRYAKITPRTLEFLRLYLGDKASSEGQSVGENGRVMSRYGFDLYLSNNVYFTATLTMVQIAVDTDTVSIAGVTFTADADGAAVGAGHWSIQGDADLCRAQLTDAVNDTGTPGVDTFIQLAASDRRRLLLGGIVATNDNSADTMTIVGYGDIVVSETLSTSTDTWSVQTLNLEFGLKNKSINLITLTQPVVDTASTISAGKIGDNVIAHTTYGSGVWNTDKDSLVRAKIDASLFV